MFWAKKREKQTNYLFYRKEEKRKKKGVANKQKKDMFRGGLPEGRPTAARKKTFFPFTAFEALFTVILRPLKMVIFGRRGEGGYRVNEWLVVGEASKQRRTRKWRKEDSFKM